MQKLNLPIINCRRLANFVPDDLAVVQCTFESTPSLALRQDWLQQSEADFASATAKAAWCEDALIVFAELSDADIFTRATGHNERLWELGDTFEIFLRPEVQEAYTELHIAPNNCRLQLRFPNAAALGEVRATGSISKFLIPGEIFNSVSWVQPAERRWFICARISAGAICEKPAALAGSQWRFSFSRYDYTRGREKPVISSTSPHAEPSFHRQHEWGALHFEA